MTPIWLVRRLGADWRSLFSNRCSLDSVELSEGSLANSSCCRCLRCSIRPLDTRASGRGSPEPRRTPTYAHFGVVQLGYSPNWGVAGSSPSVSMQPMKRCAFDDDHWYESCSNDHVKRVS